MILITMVGCRIDRTAFAAIGVEFISSNVSLIWFRTNGSVGLAFGDTTIRWSLDGTEYSPGLIERGEAC